MITGKTEAGFEFEVSENIGKDFRIVIALRKLNSDNMILKIEGMYDFVEAVLGKKGVDKIVAFAVEKKGFADSDFITEQAHEIVAIANEKSAEVKK